MKVDININLSNFESELRLDIHFLVFAFNTHLGLE